MNKDRYIELLQTMYVFHLQLMNLSDEEFQAFINMNSVLVDGLVKKLESV